MYMYIMYIYKYEKASFFHYVTLHKQRKCSFDNTRNVHYNMHNNWYILL